ncbi:unnamed protein product [Wickerhamomyces anomalus]
MAPSVKSKDLVVPYVHVAPAPEADSSAVISQSMPMAAMFMKSITIIESFVSFEILFFILLTVVSNQIRMAVVSLGVCYMELVVPGATSGAGYKKKGAEQIAESISSTIAAAVETATKK